MGNKLTNSAVFYNLLTTVANSLENLCTKLLKVVRVDRL